MLFAESHWKGAVQTPDFNVIVNVFITTWERKLRTMTLRNCKSSLASVAGLTAAATFGTLISMSPHVRADSTQTDSRIQIGYNIAPVKLNVKGLNPALVGIGSYIVNAQGDCNGCHTSPDYGGEYLNTNNPYNAGVKPPGIVNPAAYLGGGNYFGTAPGGANIFTRNLTPDITGKPEGGHTLDEFMNIMRTGHDYDMAHPACPTMGAEGCIDPATGLNASVLQIMPWPTFSHMSDDDLKAVYEYLSAIPCISHNNAPVPLSLPPGVTPPSIVYQTCPN